MKRLILITLFFIPLLAYSDDSGSTGIQSGPSCDTGSMQGTYLGMPCPDDSTGTTGNQLPDFIISKYVHDLSNSLREQLGLLPLESIYNIIYV